jgi:hypothetical protein
VVTSASEPGVDVLADLLLAPAPLPDPVDIPPRLTIAMAASNDPRDRDVADAVAAAVAALRAR